MSLDLYQPIYPLNADMVMLKKLWKEQYLRFPVLTYRSLKDSTSTPDDFYLQASRDDRDYDDHQINIKVLVDSANEEDTLTKHGIEETKTFMFYICYPLFEDIILSAGPPVVHLEPKIGDVILFEYFNPLQEWEVRTIKFPSTSYFAHSNYIFERELLCERPELGE